MNKKIARIFLLFLLMIVIMNIAFSTLLTYYGKIETTVNVQQAVLVDGKEYTYSIIDELNETVAGSCVCFDHFLINQAEKDTKVFFETDEIEGIEVIQTLGFNCTSEPVTNISLSAGDLIPFRQCYDLAINLMSGEYLIITKIIPN